MTTTPQKGREQLKKCDSVASIRTALVGPGFGAALCRVAKHGEDAVAPRKDGQEGSDDGAESLGDGGGVKYVGDGDS
jgi:hypothetical protein